MTRKLFSQKSLCSFKQNRLQTWCTCAFEHVFGLNIMWVLVTWYYLNLVLFPGWQPPAPSWSKDQLLAGLVRLYDIKFHVTCPAYFLMRRFGTSVSKKGICIFSESGNLTPFGPLELNQNLFFLDEELISSSAFWSVLQYFTPFFKSNTFLILLFNLALQALADSALAVFSIDTAELYISEQLRRFLPQTQPFVVCSRSWAFSPQLYSGDKGLCFSY